MASVASHPTSVQSSAGMARRPLGRSDLMVSSCCLGTMTYGKQNTEAEGHEQMDYAVSQGVNFFDTAELYAIPPEPETYGRTEEIIGNWFAKTGRRQEIVLATKIVGRSGMPWFRPEGAETRLNRQQIDYAVENSLKRLKTDYIDLYQLHWPDRRVNLFGGQTFRNFTDPYIAFEDTLEALNRHVEAGRVRHIGVSNETPWGVMQFLRVAEKRGWPRLASIQNAYNMLNRVFEHGLAEIAMQEQVGLLAYSPLAQGYLTGKYQGGALPPNSRKALFQRLTRYETFNADRAIDDYLALAAEMKVPPVHLALRFCDTRPFMTSTIIGATTMDQLKTAIGAFSLPWSDEVEKAVNAVHQRYPNLCP